MGDELKRRIEIMVSEDMYEELKEPRRMRGKMSIPECLKTIGIVVLVGLLAIGFSGCVKEGEVVTPKPELTLTPAITPTPKPQPKDTIKAFVNYYNNRSVDNLYALFSAKVRSKHPKLELESQIELAKSLGIKITKWEIIEEEITDKTAFLKVKMTSYMAGLVNVSTYDFRLVLENNRWLIDEWPWKTHYT